MLIAQLEFCTVFRPGYFRPPAQGPSLNRTGQQTDRHLNTTEETQQECRQNNITAV